MIGLAWRKFTSRPLLLLAVSVPLLGGCGSLHSSSPPSYRHAPVTVSASRADLLKVAAEQIGTPYRYGGNNRRGFDCSGLVQYAHRKVGVDVPRTTGQQWKHGRSPGRRHLVPGDLVFFSIGWRKGRHVGIYEGDGVFIHAPSSGKRVSRASLDNPFWQQRLIGAKTFL